MIRANAERRLRTHLHAVETYRAGPLMHPLASDLRALLCVAPQRPSGNRRSIPRDPDLGCTQKQTVAHGALSMGKRRRHEAQNDDPKVGNYETGMWPSQILRRVS